MLVNRTKFRNEIITEFVVPEKKTNKVVIMCGGMPSYPAKQKYEKAFTFWLSHGFAVFVPRYRGSWESGGEMFASSPEQDIKDVIDGLEAGFQDIWSKKTYTIKNPKVILIGSSFGGPAALLNSKDKRVSKVVAISPVIDWTTMDETVENFEVFIPFVKEAFGQGYRIAKNGWQKIMKGDFYNPATALEKIDIKKCLVLHAEDDDVISLSATKKFISNSAIKAILAKTGGHGLDMFERRFKQKVLTFLNI